MASHRKTRADRVAEARLQVGSDTAVVEYLKKLNHTSESESDRGAVLVAAAYLDEALHLRLNRFFIEHPKSEIVLARMQSADAKAQLAFVLGLVTEEELQDFESINRLRNEFAHLHTDISFADEFVRATCASFICLRDPEIASMARADSARAQFELAAGWLLSMWITTARDIERCDAGEE